MQPAAHNQPLEATAATNSSTAAATHAASTKTHLCVEQPGAKLDCPMDEHLNWSARGSGTGQAESVGQLLAAQAAACGGREGAVIGGVIAPSLREEAGVVGWGQYGRLGSSKCPLAIWECDAAGADTMCGSITVSCATRGSTISSGGCRQPTSSAAQPLGPVAEQPVVPDSPAQSHCCCGAWTSAVQRSVYFPQETRNIAATTAWSGGYGALQLTTHGSACALCIQGQTEQRLSPRWGSTQPRWSMDSILQTHHSSCPSSLERDTVVAALWVCHTQPFRH